MGCCGGGGSQVNLQPLAVWVSHEILAAKMQIDALINSTMMIQVVSPKLISLHSIQLNNLNMDIAITSYFLVSFKQSLHLLQKNPMVLVNKISCERSFLWNMNWSDDHNCQLICTWNKKMDVPSAIEEYRGVTSPTWPPLQPPTTAREVASIIYSSYLHGSWRQELCIDEPVWSASLMNPFLFLR